MPAHDPDTCLVCTAGGRTGNPLLRDDIGPDDVNDGTDQADRCVICNVTTRPEDSGLCDAHKYDEQTDAPKTPVRDGCPICKGLPRQQASGLVYWHDHGHPDRGLPLRLAIDAAGYVWRVFEDFWSMPPANPDNAPVPGPVTYFDQTAAEITIQTTGQPEQIVNNLAFQLAAVDDPALERSPGSPRVVDRSGLVEECCVVMHDAYERAAVDAGWQTQESSRKPWRDVPEANKVTMRAAVSALLDHLLVGPRRRCRSCGCTDDDCSDCVEKIGEPCRWVEADLCSACVGASA